MYRISVQQEGKAQMSEETNVMKVDSEKRSSRCVFEISENGKEQRKRTYS